MVNIFLHKIFFKSNFFLYVPNNKITWTLLKLKKKIIKRNILNDPGKRLFNFLSFPPESSNIGRLPSADSSTRHRKKEFQKNAVWGSDFEYPIQLSKYSLPIAPSAVLGFGMLCILIAPGFSQLVSNEEVGLPSAVRDGLSSSSHQPKMPAILLTPPYSWGSRGTERWTDLSKPCSP